MDSPKTVREALLADALGEALELIRRVEALPPLVEETRGAMIDAADTVTSKVSLMQEGLDALTTNAPRRVAELILKAMKDAQRAVVEEQARAMVQASKGVVDQAIAPALHGVAAQLRSLGRQQTDNLVLLVAVGAVAGIISSLCTTVLVLRFLVH